jgi:peptide/nickel transport system ATP-binding protein
MPSTVEAVSGVLTSQPRPAQQAVRPLLTVDNLRVTYPSPSGGAHAVDGATFTVQPAEMVGLVGESGCGKTTVARALTGVMDGNARITGGSVTFGGRDLLALGSAELRAVRWREIAFVPQSAMNSLDPVYRIEWQLKEVLARGGFRGRPARQRAAALLDMVGLEPATLTAYPHQLSGGMRQRVAIALALACDPQLVIADEPVTALDVIVQREVLDTLRDLQQRLRLSVIMITHDISVVAYCCDRIVVMYAGKVVESGATAAILEAAAHPYTMGLCNAFPDLTSPADQLVPILGNPPSPDETAPGCRFASRCPFAILLCHKQVPPLTDVGDGHQTACWRAGEAPSLRRQATDPATWTR